MAKLVLSKDGEVAGHYFLDAERFTIGREPSSDLCIDSDTVSKRHAAVTTTGNDQILQDLDSSNGTLVNGRRVSKHILQHGDVIEIGGCQLKYMNQKAQPDMDFDKTMIMRGFVLAAENGPGGASVQGAAPSARAARSRFPLGALKGLAGSQAGREVELSRVLATVGQPGQQLAVINRRPHGYFITHVEGRKYPLVNGKPIGEAPRALRPGDMIEVGAEKLVFVQK
jgi:hypothetical protein